MRSRRRKTGRGKDQEKEGALNLDSNTTDTTGGTTGSYRGRAFVPFSQKNVSKCIEQNTNTDESLNKDPANFHFHALEKEMATHSSVLAWRIPGTVEPAGLPYMGSHRVRHD